MKDWKLVTGSQVTRPEQVDKDSSPTTVYLRRNIKEITTVTDEQGKSVPVKQWEYEEKEMTLEEYEQMILMTTVVKENTAGIVESVTTFQKDAVIDEYTAQLIEQGVI